MAFKTLLAKWDGKCKSCLSAFAAGDQVTWDSATKAVYHPGCANVIIGIAKADKALAIADQAVLETKGMPPVSGKGAIVSALEAKMEADKVKALKATLAAKKAAKASSVVAKHFTSVTGIQNAGSSVVVPATQKAKGIVALQQAEMLSKGFAIVCQSEESSVEAATKMSLPCFVRPCPVTPRHGFVDSRVVKTTDEVRGVWQEARKADDQAELIVMPFVPATHNMVWRPGLLSVGPGHDGATGGHESVSIFLQGAYSETWRTLSSKAGVKLDSQDPFLEAVASPAHDVVVTQIRGGVKGCPTAPDWVPAAQTVGQVIAIDNDHKKDPGAMLAWETTAKGLKPGHDVVWNPGGNLGDHWSVHAQLAGVAVMTSFQPHVGQTLPQMGDELVPLEPQAIIWGYLGGLLGPSLQTDLSARKRAVCAALLGTHHGMRMGGDAGVFIGASVAFLLRLSQAALWGEARHAEHKSISRSQVYSQILDGWEKGRAGLGGKVQLFHTHKWAGGFGGKAWAAIGHGTIDLDTAMLELIRIPSRVNAKKALASLTNLVNLAHNNGWFLNKFVELTWFDLAADLDPRVALMAGPAWYDSTLVGAPERLELLSRIEGYTPVDPGKHKAPETGKKTVTGKKKATAEGLPTPVVMGSESVSSALGAVTPSKKINDWGSLEIGQPLSVGQTPIEAQAKPHGSGLHVQIKVTADGSYLSGYIADIGEPVAVMVASQAPSGKSYGGTGTSYYPLAVDGQAIKIGPIVLTTLI